MTTVATHDEFTPERFDIRTIRIYARGTWYEARVFGDESRDPAIEFFRGGERVGIGRYSLDRCRTYGWIWTAAGAAEAAELVGFADCLLSLELGQAGVI